MHPHALNFVKHAIHCIIHLTLRSRSFIKVYFTFFISYVTFVEIFSSSYTK